VSNRLCHAEGMKIKKAMPCQRFNVSILLAGPVRTLGLWSGRRMRSAIAAFGAARVVKTADGGHELIGGTADDRADAREWCSLFAHDIVFTGPPRRNSAVAFAS